jgi:hypothetical protein
MKTALLVLIAAAALSGCVAVPAEPYPVYAAPPPPVVVVRPYGYYGWRPYYGHRYRHWR